MDDEIKINEPDLTVVDFECERCGYKLYKNEAAFKLIDFDYVDLEEVETDELCPRCLIKEMNRRLGLKKLN